MWLLALAACHWTPHETGPDGMVGVVRDAAGAPVTGLAVETLEAQARTDATGRFAVTWKVPNAEVHFVRGPAFFQRRWLPSDPAVVELPLPAEREVAFGCGALDCDLTLDWALAEGFTARVATRCTPEATVELGRIPVGTPGVSCRAGIGASDEVVAVEDRGNLLVAVPPPEPLIVRIDGAPEDCAVVVDGRPASALPDGAYAGEGRGRVLATATCAGRPARPVMADVRAGEVSLAWSPAGPTLRLPGAVNELVLSCADPTGSWEATWQAAPDGTFHLPPLAPGACRFVVAPPELRSAAWAVEVASAPGTAVVREVAPGAFGGVLALPGGLATGAVPVRVDAPTDAG